MGVDFILSNFTRLVEAKKTLVEDALKFNATRGASHTYFSQISSLLELEKAELSKTNEGRAFYAEVEDYLRELSNRLPAKEPITSPRKLKATPTEWVEPTEPRRAVRVYLSSNGVDFEGERLALKEAVWPALAEICASRGVFFSVVDLQSGLKDYEASPDDLEIALNEIELSRPHFVSLMSAERYGWIPDEDKLPPNAIQAMPWLEESAGRSWGEIEALHGALNAVEGDENAPVSAFFYVRSKEFTAEVPSRLRYLYQSEGPDTDEKLQSLIARINDSGCPVRHHYPSIRVLCERVLEDLAQVIMHDHPELDQELELALPLDTARLHGDICRRAINAVHESHEEVEHSFNDHVRNRVQEPLLILGRIGSGKTSNLARLRHQLLSETAPTYATNEGAFVFYHSGRSVRDSPDRALMIRRFMTQVKAHYRLPHEVPTDEEEVLTTFYSWLELAAQSAENAGCRLPAVFIIDGLDEMDHPDGGKLLWLPTKFPKGIVCVVAGTIDDDGKTDFVMDSLRERNCPSVTIPDLSKAIQTRIVQQYVVRTGRVLTRRQVESFVQSEKTRNARYLNTLLLEFTTAPDMAESEQIEFTTSRLRATDAVEMYQQVFKRVEDVIGEQEGDPTLLGDALVLLHCSRFGLAEQELLSILECTPRAWAFLRYHIGHILVPVGGLLVLESDDLRTAVRASFITSESKVTDGHLRLAQYFGGDPALRYRSVEEFPYQLYHSGQLEVLKTAITDISMFLNLNTPQQRPELAKYWRTVCERYDKRVTLPTARALQNSLREYRPLQLSYSPLLDAQKAEPATDRAGLSKSTRADGGLLSLRQPSERFSRKRGDAKAANFSTARAPNRRPASAYRVPVTPRPPTAPDNRSRSRATNSSSIMNSSSVNIGRQEKPAPGPPTGVPLLDLTQLSQKSNQTLRRMDDEYLTHRPTGMVTQSLSELAVEAAVASVNAAISLAEFFEYVGFVKDAEAVYNSALSFTQAHKRVEAGSDGEEEEEEEEESDGEEGGEGRKKKQPDEADHFSYLEVLRRLASLHARRGRTKKAVAAYQNLMKVARTFPGVIDDRKGSIVDARHEFEYAQLVGKTLGKWKLARPLLEQSVKLRARVLGDDDIVVAETREALAEACMQLGDYHAAEVVLRSALENRLARQGPFHPGVRDARRALARAYEAQHKWSEAEALYSASLTVAETQFGTKHPDYAHAQNGLGLTGSRQGHLVQALDRLNDALAIRINQFGEGSVLVAECQSNIAWLLLQQEKHGESERLVTQAAAVQLKELGAADLAYISSVNLLINVHMATRQHDKVQEEYESLLSKLTKKLPGDHPSIVQLLRQFGKFALDDGRYEIALQHYERLLKISEKQIAHAQDPSAASDGGNSDAESGDEGDDRDEDEPELVEEMSDHERDSLLETLNVRLIEILGALGAVHQECARYDQALEYHQRLLDIYVSAGDSDEADSPEAIAVVKRIAATHYERGSLVDAGTEYEKCVQYWERHASEQFGRLREKRAADDHAARLAAIEARRREELGSDYDEEEEEEEEEDAASVKSGEDDEGASDKDSDASGDADAASDAGSAKRDGSDAGDEDNKSDGEVEKPRSPTPPPPPPIEITDVTAADKEYIRALGHVAFVHGAIGHLRIAMHEFEEILAFQELAFGPASFDSAETHAHIAWVYLERGEFDEAWEVLESAKGVVARMNVEDTHPLSLMIAAHSLNAMIQMRRHEEALGAAQTYLKNALASRVDKDAVRHRCEHARAATILGAILTENGQWDEGEEQFRDALWIREHIDKDQPTEAELAAIEEEKERAREERRRQRRIAAGKTSDDDSDFDEEEEEEEEVEEAEPEEPATHWSIGESLCNAATLIIDDEKKLDEAEELLNRALELQSAVLGAIDPEPAPELLEGEEPPEEPESDDHRLIQRTKELLEDVAKRKEKYERKKARRRRKSPSKKKKK